ncbi:hypothetical protein ACIBJF_15810 [Streptomyces sp. NPDC050743]|uniref:hypothetical protein n=1 Tax=Streptomyces sp. NPDC050743 TaxID=3365634 RepID=UPI003796EBCB
MPDTRDPWDDPTRPVTVTHRDLRALFAISGRIHGELLLGDLPQSTTKYLLARLAQDGFLEPGATADDLVQALEDLTQRLHTAWGAYDNTD